jgi:hypothetical protein
MKRTTWLRHDSQVRSTDVCTQHSDTFDTHPGTKKARLALNRYVTESTRLMAVLERALQERKAATQQCRRCRRVLRVAGKAIVKVGRLVVLPDTVMQTLRVAGAMGDIRLMAHMQALHDQVLPYRDAFEAEGLPPDVLTNLADRIKALEAARAAYAATIQEAAAARESLGENQNRASVTILALESVVPTTTQANREVVNKLQVARRVGPRKTQAGV